MYKKITHNIVEEHFDHPAVLPPKMRSRSGMPPAPYNTPDMMPENKSVNQSMETTQDIEAIYAFECAVEKLWKQHSEYSRSVMISILAGLDDINAVSARLQKNQEELGDAIIPYYGEEAAVALTGLLKDHVNTVVDIVKAIKDSKTTTDLEMTAGLTLQAIARFLDSADTVNWPYATVLPVLTELLDNALKQIKARYAKDWTGDIAANDASCETTYALATTFSNGIINKFPEMFVKQYTAKIAKKK